MRQLDSAPAPVIGGKVTSKIFTTIHAVDETDDVNPAEAQFIQEDINSQ